MSEDKKTHQEELDRLRAERNVVACIAMTSIVFLFWIVFSRLALE